MDAAGRMRASSGKGGERLRLLNSVKKVDKEPLMQAYFCVDVSFTEAKPMEGRLTGALN